MVDLITDYGKLMNKYREQVVFSSGVSILNWDMLTKMPPNGINLRSEQLALLGGIGHRMAADPEIGKLLDNIKQHPDSNSMDYIQKRNIHLISKIYAETVALPEELVVEMQRQTSIAQDVWRRAKAANNWITGQCFFPN
ncbi:MAG: hypothetical protein NTV30_03610 [Chloroflexi bacterium]|nr:hypothetical protein [Chloroflexota bacterium]